MNDQIVTTSCSNKITFRQEGDTYVIQGSIPLETANPIPSRRPVFIERVRADAFDEKLEEGADVEFLVNHLGATLARRSNGTMDVSVRNNSLVIEARLDANQSDAKDVFQKINRRDMTELSLGWYRSTEEAEINFDVDPPIITITRAELRDVSIVNRAAHSGTNAVVEMRSEQVANARSAKIAEGKLSLAKAATSNMELRHRHQLLNLTR